MGIINRFKKTKLLNSMIIILVILLLISGCTKKANYTNNDEEDDVPVYEVNNVYVQQEQDTQSINEIILRGKAKNAKWELTILNEEYDSNYIENNITVIDALGKSVSFTFEDKILSLIETELIPGMPYTILLPEGVFFDEPGLMIARAITYIVESKEKEIIEYNNNVKEVKDDEVKIDGEKLIFDNSLNILNNDIIIIPTPTKNRPNDSIAYKIDNVVILKDGKAEGTVQIATIEDVFSDLEISGEYDADPDDFIIDEDALEYQFRESGLLDLLVPTAYADSYDASKTKLKFKAKKSSNDTLVFTIEITMKELLSMGNKKNDLVVTIKLNLKNHVFVDVVQKLVFDVRVQNINSMSIGVEIKNSKGEALSDFTNSLYDNDEKYLRELEDKIRNDDEKILRLGSIPIPIAGPLTVNIDIDFFFSYSAKGELTLGNEYKTINTCGVIVSKNGIKPYSDKESEGGITGVSFCMLGEVKAGARVSVMLEACKILSVGVELEAGAYLDFGGVISYTKEKQWEGCGYIEAGVYYQFSLIAELNYFINKVDFEYEFEPYKYPFLNIKTFKYELVCDDTSVKVNDYGYIYLPDINIVKYFELNEKDVESEVLRLEQVDISFQNLAYEIDENDDYLVNPNEDIICVNPNNIQKLEDVTLTIRLKDDPKQEISFDVVYSPLEFSDDSLTNSSTSSSISSSILLNTAEYSILNTYQGEDNIYVEKAYKASDGNFIVIGGTASDEGNLNRVGSATYGTSLYDVAGNCSDAFVAKFDSQGNIIWNKSFPTKSQGVGYRKIEDNNDGTYTIVFNAGSSYSDRLIVEVLIDEEGNIISQTQSEEEYEYSMEQNINEEIRVEMVQVNDGFKCNIIDKSTETENPVVYLRKINLSYDGYLLYGNTNGNDEIVKIFSGFHEPNQRLYDDYIDSDYETDEEYCKNAEDILVMKIDINDMVEWYRFCGGSGMDIVDKAVVGNDGNFYIAGRTWSLDGDVSDWPARWIDYWTGEGSDINPQRAEWNIILDNTGNLIYSQCQAPSFEIADPDYCVEMEDGSYIYFKNESYLPKGEYNWAYSYLYKFYVIHIK